MTNIPEFVYYLNNLGFSLWVENEKIKYRLYKNCENKDDILEEIKKNRDKIIEFLVLNKRYDATLDNSSYIYHSNNPKETLSFAQERLWFIEKYEEGTSAYKVPMIFKLDKSTSYDLLEKSIRSMVHRHQILRTLIKEDEEGSAYQFVLDDQQIPLEITKRQMTSQPQLNDELSKEACYVYDLSRELPIRISLYELLSEKNNESSQHYVSIVVHHIAFDGWSVDIFLKELEEFYKYYQQKSQEAEYTLNLPELSVQYKDFALWQRNYLKGERLEKQLTYWKNKINNYEPLHLTTDNPRPKHIDYTGKDIYFEIDKDTSNALRTLAKELQVSLYSVLLSAYYLMLRSYSYQDNLIIGTPIANRHYSQVEHLIGFFVNSLALRINIDPHSLITNFIRQVGREVAEVQLYQDLPFEKLVEELNTPKDTSRHPVFQVVFAYGYGNNWQDSEEENPAHSFLQSYAPGMSLYSSAKFDISTFVDDRQECLKGSFNYAVSLYKDETIRGFIETYSEILKQLATLANHKHQQESFKIPDLAYVTEKRYDQVIKIWNQTEKSYPYTKTIHELFEEQAQQNPDKIAIVCGQKKFTYREIDEKANQLSHYIKQNYPTHPDTLVVLCLNKSEHMLLTMLAVLKAGGAYVPVDPNYPSERIEYIIKDTNTPLILIDEKNQERLKFVRNVKAKTLIIDSEAVQAQLALQSKTTLKISVTSKNLAYVVYTSGTTGNPKGVMIEHKGIVNLAITQGESLSLKSKKAIENCLWYSNYVFDAHVWEVYFAILNGYTIHILSDNLRHDINLLNAYVKENFINIALLPPALLNNNELVALDILLVGGDKTDQETLDFYRDNGVQIMNAYGPSEATVYVSLNHYQNNGATNIGSPIANTTCYVLNTDLTPLPIGAIGELYIGGVGLARGYLNQPKLTAESFIDNPFQSLQEKEKNINGKLYKTGDLVRWRYDDHLEYVGRNDFQVKMRGYRIELSEIESALNSYPKIKQGVVLLKEFVASEEKSAGHKHLVAYYVSETKLNEENILHYLQMKLPAYMVPTFFMRLEKVPLTINGKLDKEALLTPDTPSLAYIAPRHELETHICQSYQDVLSLTGHTVGIKDDFFRLGGNSILAMKLVSKINHFCQSHIKVSDIFVYKTPELLLPRIIQTKNHYKTVIKLNHTTDKPNMFMIHPGTGGCESYISLANALADHFSCYGIDSYNLYNENKIDNLNELARYYLSSIDPIIQETHQEEYHILGWSLGGQISLEIASILEARGASNIKVYLLDTVLSDNQIFSLRGNVVTFLEKAKNNYMADAKSRNYDELYVQKALSAIEVEDKLEKQKISSILKYTNILLFKAMLEDTRVHDHFNAKLHEYVSTVQYSNIDKVVKNESLIHLVQVTQAHHGNILDQEDLLVVEVISWNKCSPSEVHKAIAV